MELQPQTLEKSCFTRSGRMAPTQNCSHLLLYIPKSFAASPVCIRILFCEKPPV
jgi:hypothetical protein